MAVKTRIELAETALVGWRGRVADRAADPVANRSKLSPDEVRAIVGAAFFVMSLYYVIATVVRAARTGR